MHHAPTLAPGAAPPQIKAAALAATLAAPPKVWRSVYTCDSSAPRRAEQERLDNVRDPPRIRGAQRLRYLGALAIEQRLDGRSFAHALVAVGKANHRRCEPELTEGDVVRITWVAYANTISALIRIDLWIHSGYVVPVS